MLRGTQCRGRAGLERVGGRLELGQRGVGQASQGCRAPRSAGVCLGAPCGHRCQVLTPIGLQEEAAAPISTSNPQGSETDLLQGERCP